MQMSRARMLSQLAFLQPPRTLLKSSHGWVWAGEASRSSQTWLGMKACAMGLPVLHAPSWCACKMGPLCPHSLRFFHRSDDMYHLGRHRLKSTHLSCDYVHKTQPAARATVTIDSCPTGWPGASTNDTVMSDHRYASADARQGFTFMKHCNGGLYQCLNRVKVTRESHVVKPWSCRAPKVSS